MDKEREKAINDVGEYILDNDSEWDYLEEWIEENPDESPEQSIIYACYVAMDRVDDFKREVEFIRRKLGLDNDE